MKDEITSLKADLTDWLEKWEVMKNKMNNYKNQKRALIVKNKNLLKQNKLHVPKIIKLKSKLKEVRRAIPVQVSFDRPTCKD